MKKYNFNSGPSILPEEVIKTASEAIVDYNNSGLSILEIGHRTDLFKEILEGARKMVKDLMELTDDYEILFLQGGASTQFMQVPLNLLNQNETAAYTDNGIWGKKAIKEAGFFGTPLVVASSQDQENNYIPKDFIVPDYVKYFHYTSNNTVEGTQWHTIPDSPAPLISDMSSDIFSKPVAFNKFSLIYAGAQKNIGAAGTTLVVIKKDILGKVNRAIPTMLDYKKHIESNSLLNTAPVFAIYVSYLTLKWIIKEGGLPEMKKRSEARAKLFYDTLDSLPIFIPKVVKEDRSLMNATFDIADKEKEKAFLKLCEENGMVGIKGHRSVGGLRVSMYNALPLSSVEALCDLMRYFNNTFA